MMNKENGYVKLSVTLTKVDEETIGCEKVADVENAKLSDVINAYAFLGESVVNAAQQKGITPQGTVMMILQTVSRHLLQYIQ